MLHIHIGPDIEKKTEKDDVECEDDRSFPFKTYILKVSLLDGSNDY